MKITKFDLSPFEARATLFEAIDNLERDCVYDIAIRRVSTLKNSSQDYGPMTEQEEQEHRAELTYGEASKAQQERDQKPTHEPQLNGGW